MDGKKAFVFDTNFIIQNKELDEALDKLKDQFSVYVTQVSIDERIAQNCRELKVMFSEAEQCKTKFIHFAEISFKKSYEEESDFYRKGIQEKYEKYFGSNIIPFKKDVETFLLVIERVNSRTAPFSAAKDASDKGFKDCLLWLSLLEFFKDNGEDEIVFITDDKSAFRNHIPFLSEEFKTVTGKTIEIKQNSFYHELLNITKTQPSATPKEPLPDVAQFRDRIRDVTFDLCGFDSYDSWGNEGWDRYFSLNQRVDGNYIKVVFQNLETVIETHLFDKYIQAESVFGLDDRVVGEYQVPMTAIEVAYNLHEEVKRIYPDYLEQFYSAVASVFNNNYVEPSVAWDDEDPPF